jgi:hypothetical protein
VVWDVSRISVNFVQPPQPQFQLAIGSCILLKRPTTFQRNHSETYVAL